MHIYRDYLDKQKKEEEEREKELDALIQAEVEKQWARRIEQWRQEKAARKKLMQDVLDTRKRQIEENRMHVFQVFINKHTSSGISTVLKTSEERREAEEERKRIQANIEQHKLLEAEQQAEMKRVRQEF